MHDTTKLFLETLKDIEKRVASKDTYEVLLISALIRKLLLDDFPLLDQINRKYKTKISFEIIPSQDALIQKSEYYIIADMLDPETAPPSKKSQKVSRDQFLKTTVLSICGKRYSIKDIILFEANIMGGIHAGMPEKEKEQALQQVNSIYEIEASRGSLLQLKAIARVVLKALEPLRIQILQRNLEAHETE
jgi:hypothetical protein